jgi:ribonuclease HII
MNNRYEQQKLRQGFDAVIGCDEVGRGCLAGPVVAAAVVLDMGAKQKWVGEIKDSKLLSPAKRSRLASLIQEYCLGWGVGVIDSSKIDEVNIHYATLLAMAAAVNQVSERMSKKGSHLVVVDGRFTIPGLRQSQEAIIDGDNKILSISAASIVAKVFRDEYMVKQHQKFPEYRFAEHKGYATVAHREAINKHGLTPLHRLSFCANIV